MRFPNRLLTGAAAAALTAFAASAQDGGPPAEGPPAEAKAEPSHRLQDVQQTVDELLREEGEPAGQAEPPAETPAAAEPEPQPVEAAPPPPAPVTRAPSATAPAGPPPPLTREQIATLDRTVERGRLLVAIARAGIVATQDMLTRVSDPSGAGIAGWIAEPAGSSTLVTFYADGSEGAAPKAVYRATVIGSRVTSREVFLGEDRPALTPPQARMAAARMASESDALQACGAQAFNALIIPPASPRAPIDVYRISPPASRNRLPMGGHFRTTVAADGSLSESRAFSRGCLNVELSEVPAGSQAGPIAITHLLDPLPTEMHVFLSLFSGRPLVVAAGDPTRLFMVAGDAVREIRR